MNSKKQKIKITSIGFKKGVFPFSEICNRPIKVVRISNESINRCNKTIEPLIEERYYKKVYKVLENVK